MREPDMILAVTTLAAAVATGMDREPIEDVVLVLIVLGGFLALDALVIWLLTG
jgi:hypothetical protein